LGIDHLFGHRVLAPAPVVVLRFHPHQHEALGARRVPVALIARGRARVRCGVLPVRPVLLEPVRCGRTAGLPFVGCTGGMSGVCPSAHGTSAASVMARASNMTAPVPMAQLTGASATLHAFLLLLRVPLIW